MNIAIVVVLIIAGIADAIRDVLTFHWSASVFGSLPMDSFFGSPNATTGSWVRKYKNRDPKAGPAFFGSTTFLVGVTDAFHLSKTLSIRLPMFFLCAAILVGGVSWIAIGIGLIANSAAFNLTYYFTRKSE
jgi:hypothetical protein